MSNKSTGPRSAEGKARSSMNAMKTGIYSQHLLIPGENPDDLDALTKEYYDRYRPPTPEQRDLVDILIRTTWTLRRLSRAEAAIWESGLFGARLGVGNHLGQAVEKCGASLARLSRIVNATQRNFQQSLHELERLRKLPPEPLPDVEEPAQPSETKSVINATEFVPSNSLSAPPTVPAVPSAARPTPPNATPITDSSPGVR